MIHAQHEIKYANVQKAYYDGYYHPGSDFNIKLSQNAWSLGYRSLGLSLFIPGSWIHQISHF